MGLTVQMLFAHPRESLPDLRQIVGEPQGAELSYSMADCEVLDVKEVAAWLTVEQYAERQGIQPAEVKQQWSEGALGHTLAHSETGELLILWSVDETRVPPEVGKKTFKVTVRTRAEAPHAIQVDPDDASAYEKNQEQFLQLAHSIGKPAEAADRAQEMLHRSGLLLCWTSFEVFLRSTIHELMRQQPRRLADSQRSRKKSLTYAELSELSLDFTSAESLLARIVDREIADQQSSNESILGLIKYLKSEFKLSRDPFEAWYVIRGERRVVNYNDLSEMRDVRNSLVHEAGRVSLDFQVDHPAVDVRDGHIVVDEERYMSTVLALRSIAYQITRTIVQDSLSS